MLITDNCNMLQDNKFLDTHEGSMEIDLSHKTILKRIFEKTNYCCYFFGDSSEGLSDPYSYKFVKGLIHCALGTQ